MKSVSLYILLSLGLTAFAASSPEAEIKTSRAEKSVTVQVVPPPGTHLNFDGPWKLQVSGAVPLSNTTGVFGLDTFDKSKQQFVLPLTRAVKADERGEYSLVYFFCAADNSWCRRAQAKGTL